MALLFYKRPDYVNKHQGPVTSSDCFRYVERAKNSKQTIPEGLSFENVISNLSLPPCGLGDFMDYLYYIEETAENLQFILWYRDYTRRFEEISDAQKLLSPKWEQQDTESDDFSADLEKFDELGKEVFPWQPFTIQPMRDEIDSIMHHYIVQNSPRALNLSDKDRNRCLHALQHTTHPSALAPAAHVANLILRGQSHPNFIRWSICNGNKPRVFFLRYSGILSMIGGCLFAILMILSSLSRWYRIFVSFLFLLGIAIVIASYNGLCILMHQTRVRNVRPWEQFVFDQETGEACEEFRASSSSKRDGHSLESARTLDKHLARYQPLGPRNSYESESWVQKYKKSSILKKIFPRTVWSQDKTLKKMQDKIVLESCLWAMILTLILVAIIVAIPSGRFY